MSASTHTDAPITAGEPDLDAVTREGEDPRPPEPQVRVQQDTDRNSRIYYLEFNDGTRTWRESLWSVTTLLQVLDKPALIHWAAKATARAAFEGIKYLASDLERYGLDDAIKQLADARYKQKSRASDIGTAVHALIDHHIVGGAEPPIDPTIEETEVRPRFEQFLRWEEEYRPIYRGAEMTVFNPEHGWAGTLDFIAEIGNRGEGLVDVKNTNPTKDGKPGVYFENHLQLAAYANATEIAARRGAWVFPVPMPELQWGCILWLYPGRKAFVEANIGPKSYRAFLVASEMYRYKDGDGKKAIYGEQSPATFGILPTPEEQAAAIAEAQSTPGPEPDPEPPAPDPAEGPPVITDLQRKRMLGIGRKHGMSQPAVKALVTELTGATSTTRVPVDRYEEVCAAIEKRPKVEASA